MSLVTQVILLISWVPASGFCLIKPLIWLYERSQTVVGTVKSPHKAFFFSFFFAILQLLFKLSVESLFQFLELSHFICLAHQHTQSSSAREQAQNKQPWFYRTMYFTVRENTMRGSTQSEVFMPGCITLGEGTASFTKPHSNSAQSKTQASTSAPLCRQSLKGATLHMICCYKKKGLDRANNFQICKDSVFCAKITCSWHNCECPLIQPK